MLMRLGFVSNSSSSSFIVAFPKHMGSAFKMGEYLFGPKYNPTTPINYYDYEITMGMAAQIVYEDYCKAKMNATHTARIAAAETEIDAEEVKKLLTNNPDYTIITLEYSDNDGPTMTAMEHGGVFDNVPSHQISMH